MEELISKLLAHYEDAKQKVSLCEDKRAAEAMCDELKVDAGVCYTAATVFGKCIGDEDWANSKKKDESPYWHSRPVFCNQDIETVEDVLETLQVRIDILRQYPN